MSDTDETQAEETDQLDAEQVTEENDDHSGTFPRAYVEKLRTEAKDNRHRAETAEQNLDAVMRELFTAKVSATGKLADPDDLPYDAELLDDDKLTAAIDELTTRKPHLAARKASGSVGQGVTSTKDEPFSLLGRLQQSV
ncbi:hypothetical protein HGA11_22020 [Mycolicibacterium septicum DSM 44393]|uniref:Uncharacterized protein n=1 Tax=Mycolicibacterium septicum DSM 44393 TaxID=1341646 RepID=A0A7X6RXP8_9MYCO|nr:hypothetical protein [Mycolicibacterium septicum]NKZ13658.1 hypothetical protein [Mycolicibacterium septicum DSM 44393]